MKVPFSKVVCDGNELKYVREVLESGWLTTASKTHEFERRFAEQVEAPYACAVTSCTAALHLALEAVGVGPGDKVFVPTMTFTASAEVIRYLGADPVFLDVDYGTVNITPEILEAAIQRHPEVRALILVHYGGQPAELLRARGQGIIDLCRANGIKLVEDAAHAFPSRLLDRPIGGIGDVACFSFYANKTITTGEGGMLTTNDERIYQRVKLMRLHGMSRDAWDRYTSDKPKWDYDIVAPGYKYNMSDINAAIGLAQLERAYELRDQRQRCVDRYFERLSGRPEIDLPRLAVPREHHSWHLFHIVLTEQSALDRDQVVTRLGEHGIGTGVHYKPIHRMTYYREPENLQPKDFPNAEAIFHGCLSLPLFPSLTNEQVDYVCDTLLELTTA